MGATQVRELRNLDELRTGIHADLSGMPPRARILIAARELFYRFGVHAVGVDTIADVALTNKMTLYRHFRSKDDLIVAYVEQLVNDNVEILERLLGHGAGDPQEKLDAWIDHIEDVLANRLERGCALSNAAVELDVRH